MLARGERLIKAEFRAGYLSSAWDLFHDLVGIDFVREPSRAVDVAEAARRALFRRDTADVRTSAVSRLPPDTILLYYSVLRDRVLVWRFDARGETSRAIPFSESDLAADVDAFRSGLIARAADPIQREIDARLYDRLLAPVLTGAGGAIAHVLVAADGPLVDLPFAALPQSGGAPLAERFAISMITRLPGTAAPSPAGIPRHILTIGYSGAGSGLPILNGAEQEAALVGGLYPQQTALIGSDASPDLIRQAALPADVIHVAAHAVANRLMPWESRLVLAPSGEADGSLRFDAIEGLDLRRCRLVVLSACETAAGARVRGQGLLSLASPFLDAGAGTVIGSLWPVDDRASVPFMTLLHRRIVAGASPADALRAAQRDARASSDPLLNAPSTWAAYVVMAR